MASPKPKPEAADSPKKVFDVARPGKSTPDATARPIIVTNRPILQDPMMANGATAATTANEEDELAPAKAKLTIKPITVTTDEAGSDEVVVKKKEKAKAPEPKEPETKEPPEEASPEKPEEPAEPTEAATPDNETAEPEATEEPETQQKPDEPTTAEEPDAATPEPEEKASEPETGGKSPIAQTPEQQDVAAKKAEEEAAKHEAEVQKLVDDEKYFLPINTVESRKTKRFVVLGALLIVVLGLAWADVALDAGLIHITGVKALTHFFTH
ncbi:MAG TPA: hypothetical protein VLG13_03270 [Patescibacteria group bacterium]|nr:hypothetical protein [Patescibacteria group bacterium]